MKSAVKELCWRNRTKPSPYLAGLVREVTENPREFLVGTPPAGGGYISLYIDDETWKSGVATATQYQTTLSAMVRTAILRDLTAAGIPWPVTIAVEEPEDIPARE
jgi:hypothetical protein